MLLGKLALHYFFKKCNDITLPLQFLYCITVMSLQVLHYCQSLAHKSESLHPRRYRLFFRIIKWKQKYSHLKQDLMSHFSSPSRSDLSGVEAITAIKVHSVTSKTRIATWNLLQCISKQVMFLKHHTNKIIKYSLWRKIIVKHNGTGFLAFLVNSSWICDMFNVWHDFLLTW